MNEVKFPMELFGLKDKDGNEWKLKVIGYGSNWIEVNPVIPIPTKAHDQYSTDQYSTIIRWISSCDGTSGIFFPEKLEHRTLNLLNENDVHLTIRIIKEGFFIER